MCGRYTLKPFTKKALLEFFPSNLTFELDFLTQFGANYNAAPSQNLPVILPEDDRLVAQGMTWGLAPGWARAKKIKPQINARSETVAQKPMFRSAFKTNRLVVPASGFFEWEKIDEKTRKPYAIMPAKEQLFLFAGIWDGPEDDPSFAILTTAANDKMSEIHERMPVTLKPDDLDLWLDPDITEPEPLEHLFHSAPDDAVELYPVSKAVNSIRNNSPKNIEPLEGGY